mmetsp:Transcript_60385/g.127958  ORF Transcript_60385/g.127958 Transcript_60385/m.127958 type:complete len:289 (-) Transcript_60385:117-983(-)
MGASCCGRCKEWSKYRLYDLTWKESFGKPGGIVGGLRCMSPPRLLMIRIVLFLTWLGCIIASLIENIAVYNHPWPIWFTKATHLTGLMELTYFALACCTTYQAIYSKVPDGVGRAVPWYAEAAWVFNSLATVSSFVICTAYWSILKGDKDLTVVTVLQHGGGFVLMLIDLLISRVPYYLSHIYAPLIASSSYVVFSYIYFVCGGTDGKGHPYIYKVLDWRNPSKAGFVCVGMVFLMVPLAYFLFLFFTILRSRCRKVVSGQARDVREPGHMVPTDSRESANTNTPFNV